MSEKKLSLIELHFHESVQFGPRKIPGLGGGSDEKTADGTQAGLLNRDESPAQAETASDETEDDDSSPCYICRLVGLGVLAGAAYIVKKLLDGESTGLDALDNIETEAEDEINESARDAEPVSIEVTGDEESESSSGRTGRTAATVIALLVVLALVARKLLGDTVEEIEIPEELAEE